MKQTITKGWNGIRALRLFAGLAILAQGLYVSDWLFAITGIIFTVLAIFNTGCCAGSSCHHTQASKQEISDNVTYEEVG